jgi:hypothetical protein
VIAAVKREGELAEAVGGYNLPDSEPADVVVARDAEGKPVRTSEHLKRILASRQEAVRTLTRRTSSTEAREAAQRVLELPCFLLEVKTLLVAEQGVVHISGKALRRKERWEQKYAASFSVVAVDDRKGTKHSGHRVYIAPNELAKTFRLRYMMQVQAMADVLKHLEG